MKKDTQSKSECGSSGILKKRQFCQSTQPADSAAKTQVSFSPDLEPSAKRLKTDPLGFTDHKSNDSANTAESHGFLRNSLSFFKSPISAIQRVWSSIGVSTAETSGEEFMTKWDQKAQRFKELPYEAERWPTKRKIVPCDVFTLRS